MRGIKVLVVMLAAASMASILTVPISTAQGGQKIQILFQRCLAVGQGYRPVINPDPAMVRPGDQVEWFVSAAVEGSCGIKPGTVNTVEIDFPRPGPGAKPGANGSPFDPQQKAQTFTFRYPGSGPTPAPTVLNVPEGKYPYSIVLRNNVTGPVCFNDEDGNRVCAIDPALIVGGPVPTLTEWGLIALAVLLAGSLAFMIRRRLAPRPAGA
jgi:hypothetical protein